MIFGVPVYQVVLHEESCDADNISMCPWSSGHPE